MHLAVLFASVISAKTYRWEAVYHCGRAIWKGVGLHLWDLKKRDLPLSDLRHNRSKNRRKPASIHEISVGLIAVVMAVIIGGFTATCADQHERGTQREREGEVFHGMELVNVFRAFGKRER
jgi:hypothetical protein